MEIVGSDEQMACVGFALTPSAGGGCFFRSDRKNDFGTNVKSSMGRMQGMVDNSWDGCRRQRRAEGLPPLQRGVAPLPHEVILFVLE